MKIDLINTYFPEAGSIPSSDLSEARRQVVEWLRPVFPDDSMLPGTVLGDGLVSQASVWVAARRISLERFTSDLSARNISNNIIYNCPFVAEYLASLGVYAVEDNGGRGSVRLTFSTAEGFNISNSTYFLLGEGFFKIRRYGVENHVTVLPAGSLPSEDQDTYVKKLIGVDLWAVDFHVRGDLVNEVAAGVTGSVSEQLPGLVAVVTLSQFHSGASSKSLPALARRSQMTTSALTPANKSGTQALVSHAWPDVSRINVIAPGDPEMLRMPPSAPLALLVPSVDVYIQSDLDHSRTSQFVKLSYNSVTGVFRGKVDTLNRISRIVTLTHDGDSDVINSFSSYSRTLGYYADAGLGTTSEELWLEVEPALDPFTGTVLIARSEEGGQLYAWFEITYDHDPLLADVTRHLTSVENRPIGVDISVKQGPLVKIDSLNVNYVSQAGVRFLSSECRRRITQNIRHSNNAFSIGQIQEVVRLAGASRVTDVQVTGVTRFTSTSRRFFNDFDPGSDDNWVGNSIDIPSLPFTSTHQMLGDYLVSGVVTNQPRSLASTTRVARYYIEENSVNFEEVRG